LVTISRPQIQKAGIKPIFSHSRLVNGEWRFFAPSGVREQLNLCSLHPQTGKVADEELLFSLLLIYLD